MQPLLLDFSGRVSTERRIAISCLTVIAAVIIFMGVYYARTLQEVEALRSQRALVDKGSAPIGGADSPANELESARLQAAKGVVGRLGTPWPDLFVALEDTANSNVSVIHIEPDVGRQEVHITAHAASIASAVAYAHALQTTGVLSGVYLTSHREDPADLIRPFQVVVAGRWMSGKRESAIRAAQSQGRDANGSSER